MPHIVALKLAMSESIQWMQNLRTCDEFSGFRTISRGRSPREIVQLRKS